MALAKSDPGIVFLARLPNGIRAALWTPENHFTTNERPAHVTVVVNSHQSRVHARISPCPLGHPECRSGQFFPLEVPASGQLNLDFANTNGPVTLELQRMPLHPLFLLFLFMLAAALAVLFTGEARVLAVPTVLACGLYFSITLGQWRGLDVSGHLMHVQKIASDGLFVNAGACWECFHPPLYYALSSALLGFPTMITPSGATVLQGVALLLHCLAIPLVVAALRSFASNRRGLLLYSALVCLWPAGILQSARLGNDGPLNLLAFATLLLLLRNRILLAAGVAAAGLLVKQSAVVLIALVVLYAAWLSARKAISARTLTLCFLIMSLGLGAGWATQKAKHFEPKRMTALSEQLEVKNTLVNMTLLDPVAFVGDSFVNPWLPTTNRNFLMNYFWKTSLFGEWSYSFPYADALARALSAALLMLLTIAALSWLNSGLPLFPALTIALAFSSVWIYRYIYPFACNPDFRFVYPLAGLAMAVILARARNGAEQAARWVTLCFLGLSQSFFLLLWWFES